MSWLPPSRKSGGGRSRARSRTGGNASAENAASASKACVSSAASIATPAPSDQPTAPTCVKCGRNDFAASAATRSQIGNGSGPRENPWQKPCRPGGGVGSKKATPSVVTPYRGSSAVRRWSNVLKPPHPCRTMTARAPDAGPQRIARTGAPPLRKSARSQPAPKCGRGRSAPCAGEAAAAAMPATATRRRSTTRKVAGIRFRRMAELSVKRSTFLGFQPPAITDAEIDAVAATLRSGWLTTGPRTVELEARMRDYLEAKHVLAVSSCTAALHLSLVALGVGPGDEVITSSITWPATANVIVHCGATPVFADVLDDTLNIDPDCVRELVSARTKAIVPVDLYGQPADLDPLLELGVPVVEDAAHAAESRYRGRKVGGIADLTCFSLYATKNIAAGEG